MLLVALAIIFAISITSLIGGLLLIYKKSWANILSKYLINFAIGALLGVAFLDLLPEAIEIQSGENILIYSLAGIIIFYLGEKTLLWYHHHSLDHIMEHGKHHPPEEKIHPVGYLITFGDAFHNFLDGIIIMASFLVDFKLGVMTSLAVLFHELPQEIGDFAVMLHAGIKKSRVFIYNLCAQLAAVIGAALAYFYLPFIENFEAIFLAIAAGGFIYIASTDLLPETHKERSLNKSVLQFALLILGILTVWFLGFALPE